MVIILMYVVLRKLFVLFLFQESADSDLEENSDSLIYFGTPVPTFDFVRIKIKLYVENVVSRYDEIQFQQNFRMKRKAFDCLLAIVQQNMPSQ